MRWAERPTMHRWSHDEWLNVANVTKTPYQLFIIIYRAVRQHNTLHGLAWRAHSSVVALWRCVSFRDWTTHATITASLVTTRYTRPDDRRHMRPSRLFKDCNSRIVICLHLLTDSRLFLTCSISVHWMYKQSSYHRHPTRYLHKRCALCPRSARLT